MLAGVSEVVQVVLELLGGAKINTDVDKMFLKQIGRVKSSNTRLDRNCWGEAASDV